MLAHSPAAICPVRRHLGPPRSALRIPRSADLLSSIFDLPRLRSCAFSTVAALLSCAYPALGQDLSPISFLQRPQINSAILEGTPTREVGKPRGATTNIEDLSGAARGPGEEAARGPGVSDIAQSIAFALTPRAVHLSFSTSLRLEYDSNITIGSNGDSRQLGAFSNFGLNRQGAAAEESDFIVTNMLNTAMTWQFAGGSSVGLSLGVGYRQYLQHSEFSGLVLNTGAPGGLAFQFATGEVNWTLYDHFSYNNDPAGQSELSGVSNFSSFSNSYGLEGAWSPAEQWLLRGGYEHTYQSIESDQQSTKRNSDALQFAAIYGVTPLIQTGLSASVTASRDKTEIGNSLTSANSPSRETKSIAFSIGPFVRGQVTNATNVFLTAGVQIMRFDESESDTAGGGDKPSYYGSLRINNSLTQFYSHSLEIGRDSQLGIVSNSVKTDYIRYSGSWNITHGIALSPRLFAERGEQSGGQFGDKFLRYGGGLTLSIPLRPTIAAQVGWEYTKKDSNQDGFDYSRHRVFAEVSWHF